MKRCVTFGQLDIGTTFCEIGYDKPLVKVPIPLTEKCGGQYSDGYIQPFMYKQDVIIECDGKEFKDLNIGEHFMFFTEKHFGKCQAVKIQVSGFFNTYSNLGIEYGNLSAIGFLDKYLTVHTANERSLIRKCS